MSIVFNILSLLYKKVKIREEKREKLMNKIHSFYYLSIVRYVKYIDFIRNMNDISEGLPSVRNSCFLAIIYNIFINKYTSWQFFMDRLNFFFFFLESTKNMLPKIACCHIFYIATHFWLCYQFLWTNVHFDQFFTHGHHSLQILFQ